MTISSRLTTRPLSRRRRPFFAALLALASLLLPAAHAQAQFAGT